MNSPAWWPTVAVMIVASATDIRSRRIPNWLVVPFLAIGVVASTALQGTSGLVSSGLGILLGALVMTPIYVMGGTGMGDVKLCAALGAWIGPHQLGFALAFMGLAGGLMAFGWSALRGSLDASMADSGELIAHILKRGPRPHERLVITNPSARSIPYAPAIAIGAILSFFVKG